MEKVRNSKPRPNNNNPTPIIIAPTGGKVKISTMPIMIKKIPTHKNAIAVIINDKKIPINDANIPKITPKAPIINGNPNTQTSTSNTILEVSIL